MTRSNSSPPAPRRNVALVTIDALVGILLLVIAVAISFGVLVSAFAYGGIQAECGTGAYPGLVCNSIVLGIVVYGLIGISVLAAFLALGMMIVSAIRKRYIFWWPLGAIVLTVGFFYLGSWVAGMTVP